MKAETNPMMSKFTNEKIIKIDATWKIQQKNGTFMEILVNRRQKMPAVDSICNGEDFCDDPLYYPSR